jgi:hypothetical protein
MEQGLEGAYALAGETMVFRATCYEPDRAEGIDAFLGKTASTGGDRRKRFGYVFSAGARKRFAWEFAR